MGTWSKTKDRRPDRARGKKAKKHHEPPSRVDLLEFKLQVTEYDRTQTAPIYTGDHIHKEPHDSRVTAEFDVDQKTSHLATRGI